MKKIQLLFSIALLFSATYLSAQTATYTGRWIKVYDDGVTRVSADYRVTPNGNCSKISVKYNIEGQAQSRSLSFPMEYVDCSGNIKTFTAQNIPLGNISKYINSDLEFQGTKILTYDYLGANGYLEKKVPVSDYLPNGMKWEAAQEFYRDKNLTGYVQFALSSSACDPNGFSSFYRFKFEGKFREYPETIEGSFKFKDCTQGGELKTRRALLQIGTGGRREIQSMDMIFTGTAVESVDQVAAIKQKYTVNVTSNTSSAGSQTGGGVYGENELVSLTAQPTSEFNFVCWKINGVEVSKSTSYQFTVSQETEAQAIYRGKYSHLNLSSSDTYGGDVTGAGKYTPGTLVSIKATPAEGWNFLYWQEGGSNLSFNKDLTFALDYDRDIKAIFEKKKYKIDVTMSPPKAGSITGDGTYSYNSTAYLYATPKSKGGYTFKKWESGGKTVSKTPNYSVNVKEDVNLKAVFSKDVGTRIQWDFTPSFISRPMLFYTRTAARPQGYYEVVNRMNYGAAIDLGWRPVQMRNFLFGILVGGTAGSNYLKANKTNSNGSSEVTNSRLYTFNFGTEIGVGGPKAKLLFRYLNSIEASRFDLSYTPSNESAQVITDGKFDVRREVFQLGLLANLGSRKSASEMDLHFNLGRELAWDWSHPAWIYNAAASTSFDYGGGLYFNFKWFTIGADVNANVEKMDNFSKTNLYFNSKIGFNFAKYFRY
jgi:hypothetical protein